MHLISFPAKQFPLSRQSRLNSKKFRTILVSGYDDPGSQGWDRINKRVFQRHVESNASPYLDCQRWNPIYPTDSSVDK